MARHVDSGSVLASMQVAVSYQVVAVGRERDSCGCLCTATEISLPI